MPQYRTSSNPYRRALEAKSSRQRMADLGVAATMGAVFLAVVGVGFFVLASDNFHIPAQLSNVATGGINTVLPAR